MYLRNILFKYIYCKVLVTLLRTFVTVVGTSSVQRSRALVPRNSRVQRGIKIPSRDEERYIEADIYWPDGLTGGVPPVLVNWHGSGFIMPYFGSDAFFCSRVAQGANIAVLDVDYRKSPETPYPGAINDAEDTLLWVYSQKHRFDSARIAVSGFSAGGNIALVAATKLRKKFASLITIHAALLMYPLINLAAPPETKRVPRPIRPFQPWLLRLLNDSYAPDPSTRTDPAVSGYFADPDDFPQTVALMTCEGDVLRPEAEELGDKLRRNDGNGKKVIEHVLKGVRHGFDNSNIVDGSIEHVRREELYTLAIDILKDVFRR
ncbi:Alpha/Beta hydrolase protein [Xylaria flabelliformis]|nr:Alpha/Beta hydrolase protein [Xylaria flabelliformis]